MKPEHLAKEAERLLRDEVLNHALDKMRAEGMECLFEAQPDDMKQIIRCQEFVRTVDEFRDVLRRWILAVSE